MLLIFIVKLGSYYTESFICNFFTSLIFCSNSKGMDMFLPTHCLISFQELYQIILLTSNVRQYHFAVFSENKALPYFFIGFVGENNILVLICISLKIGSLHIFFIYIGTCISLKINNWWIVFKLWCNSV